MYLFEKQVNSRTGSYTYICLGHNKRENGQAKRVWEATLCRKDKLEESLTLIKRKLSGRSREIEEHPFGLEYALLSICDELGLVDIINECVEKRDGTIPVGAYLTVLIVNRASVLNSKNKMQSWFDKTTLSRRFPQLVNALSPQNIFNQMAYLDQETIRSIESKIYKALVTRFKTDSDCFLFDPTNFFTYIREHEKNTIAQRGHNKKKRTDLRQVNASLLVTRNDFNLPIMHETYEGNIPDVTHFKAAIRLMEQRFKAIGMELPAVTLVFDKGNNSDDAYAMLDKDGIHFVSSVRPSMAKVKNLFDIPLSEYTVLWTKENGTEVLGYRTSSDLYLGKENTIVATFDHDTFDLHEYNLNKTIHHAEIVLKTFVKRQLNSKPQWMNKVKVVAKIDRDILKTKELRKLIPYTITKGKGELQITWYVDAVARDEALKDAGKSIIFTNQNTWSTVDIVKTYRAQKGVEDQFKALNNRNRIAVMPMYHWTDQKIRAHIFISVMALLVSNLLYRKLSKNGVDASAETCIDALEGIKEIHTHYEDNLPPDIVLTRLSPLQKLMVKILDLKRKYLP
jgi:transposase